MAIMDRVKAYVRMYLRPHMIVGFRNSDGSYCPNVRYSSSVVFMGLERLKMDDLVFIFHDSIIDATNGMTIGEGTQIGAWTGIFTHSSHIAIRLYGDKYREKQNQVGYVRGSVSIGSYVFVGPHSIVMPGTSIGKGSIVSAFSYVRGDFPDFSIISGNPAKIVGDTRSLDKKYLEANPELLSYYEAWAGPWDPTWASGS